MRPPTESRWAWGWVAVLAALVYLLKHGYAYGTGDHDEMLPQLLRLLDPDLYPRDPFVVEQGARFTVRTPFLWLLRAVCLVLPPPAALAAVWAAGLAAVAAGVFALGRALSVDRPPAALATVVAVGVISTWTVSGSALAFRALVPEMLAWALALPALRWAVRGEAVRAGVFLALAAYLQLLVGALTTGVLALALVLGARGGTARERWAEALKLGGAALAVALPLAVLVLRDRATGPPVPADGLPSWFLIVELRLPHHYLPSHFGAGAWLRFGTVAAAGTAALLWLRQCGRPLVFAERFALAVALVCAAAWVLVEGAQSLLVAQLQVFKTTVPLVALWVTAAAAAGFGALPYRLREAAEAPFRRPAAAWAATLAAAVGVALLLAGPLQPRLDVRRPADARAAERWAATQTARDALFVVPPSNTWFRSGSRRSVAVTFKPTAFQEGSTHVWYRRLLQVAPAAAGSPTRGFAFAQALDDAYAHNAPSDWRALAATTGADYALVDAEHTVSPPPGRPVFQSGRWAVYAL